MRIDLILDSAEAVFAEKGMVYATMDDIAKKAELGKSSLYTYFKSKEIIIVGLDLRGARIQIKLFSEAIKKGETGLEQVLEIGRTYLDFAREYQVYFWAKIHLGRLDPEEVVKYADDPIVSEFQKTIMDVQKIVIDSIIAGQKDGSILPDLNPLTASLLLWSQANGLIEVILNRGDVLEQALNLTVNDLVEQYIVQTRNSLANNS